MSRQTKTFLMKRLREIGIEPTNRHGQNFLIDLNLVEMIVAAADLGPNDVVLEVGTGTGSLTALIAQRASAVVTVEIDAHLFALASEELLAHENVTMLRMDALKNKNRFDARVMETVGAHLAAAPGRQLKLVANLPYNVATPVLSNLLLAEHVPVMMVATIQKELAERIVAPPSTRDYSALSVWIQSQCHAEIVRTMPPSVFWPAPKVHSAIIKIAIDRERRMAIGDRPFFHQFVKALFFHRRKFLRANVLAALKQFVDKPQIDQLLAEMGFASHTRTEQVDVDTLLRFAQRVQQLAPDWKL